jgi:hypothetical protein
LSVEAASPLRPARLGFGAWLAVWAFASVMLQASAWLSGLRGADLARAVERGAATVETAGIGELGDDAVREAIRTQRDTLPFWATLVAIGDFLGEPLGLALRASLAAVLFAGIAALTGRPTRFEETLADCARAQGFWVLGLATRVGLMLALDRPEVETSATLLLAEGPQPASAWVALRQLDAFALVGWSALAWGARRRGQVGLIGALALCGVLWMGEAIGRVLFDLIVGAGMRLSILPG